MRGLASTQPLVRGSWLGPCVAPLYLAVPVPGVQPIFVVLPYSAPMVRQWLHVTSVYRGPGNFTRFLREGGPRILRSFFVVLLDFLAGLLLTMHFVLCFLRLCHVWPVMLGIMAVLDQKDSYAVACARLGLLVFFPSRCVPLLVGLRP